MQSHSPAPARWEKTGDTAHAACRVFDVRRPRYRHPTRGVEKEFFAIHSTDWVNTLALTADHQLVLVRQFRFGVDAFSLEIPGGMIEPAEEPLSGGLRELREETGFSGDRARVIGRVHPNPAIQTNNCHFVLVENCVRAAGFHWDADEEMELLTAPVDEVYALAHAGRITHALVLNALFFFAPHWERIKAAAV